MTPDIAEDRLKLWFFRDLTDEQRMKLFSVCGYPTKSHGVYPSLGTQEIILKDFMKKLRGGGRSS